MKDEKTYEAVPLKREEQKKDNNRTLIITIGLVVLLGLLIWLMSRSRGKQMAVLCLSEVLPMLEG